MFTLCESWRGHMRQEVCTIPGLAPFPFHFRLRIFLEEQHVQYLQLNKH